MKKDTPKRDRDSDNTPISSKTTKITTTNTIRTDRFSSGGGGGGDNSAAGGSGIVIIRYPDIYKDAVSTTATKTTYTGYKVYTFTSSGSIMF